MKVSGFDAITKKTKQMAKFAEEIDGEFANVSFDPTNPASIEAALQKINDAIDEKTKAYERNDWIQNLAAQLKQQARNKVLEKAAAARMGDES